MHVTTTPRREDSVTIQRNQVPGVVDPTADTERIARSPRFDRRTAQTDILLIPERDGTAGVFEKNTGRRIGTIDEDGAPIDPMADRAWTFAHGFSLGACAGLGLAGAIAIIACRYWLTLPH